MSALKLKEIMNDRGIGNKELSERSGVPLGTLNKILYGDTPNPGLETMWALATVLDCTLDDFLERPGYIPIFHPLIPPALGNARLLASPANRIVAPVLLLLAQHQTHHLGDGTLSL